MHNPECPIVDIDLEYRPAHYFWPHSLETHLLATVKGAERQRYIRMLDSLERLPELPGYLAAESLSEEERTALGRVHPSLMGGEYLPDLRSREIEIARISLRSVTGDVISVRARQGRGRISYRIVDEYGGDCLSEQTRRTSARPLTLAQLENFIELAGAGMVIVQRNLGGGSDLDSLEDFLTASSPFYPELEALYSKRISDWAEGIRAEYADE